MLELIDMYWSTHDIASLKVRKEYLNTATLKYQYYSPDKELNILMC